MMGRKLRLRAALPAAVAACALALPATAAAHSFAAWTGSKNGFFWEAKRLSCGVVGGAPSRVHAHTRWTESPANGYVRLTFVRQLRDEDTGDWVNVHKQRRSTRNTDLEGSRAVLHWTQWFNPYSDEAGATSRHIVAFEWFRDRPGKAVDPRMIRRTLTFAPCVVGGPLSGV